ncbi:MAG TPA: MFS transporter, partial [Conexibacter sp.]|nr:MFS transporter [Conexibacter sp.]
MRSREGSRSRRSPRAAIYALIVLTDGLHIAIVPLLPRFAGRFSLGGVAAGALLAGPGVAMALVSLPGGRLVDRFEPRRVAVCSAVALAIAAAGQAAAPTFAVLMGARLLGGLAMGLAWISAAAWIVRVVAPEDSARALGALVTAAGAGIVGGPVVAGLTAQWLGTAAPFLLIATASAVVAG